MLNPGSLPKAPEAAAAILTDALAALASEQGECRATPGLVHSAATWPASRPTFSTPSSRSN